MRARKLLFLEQQQRKQQYSKKRTTIQELSKYYNVFFGLRMCARDKNVSPISPQMLLYQAVPMSSRDIFWVGFVPRRANHNSQTYLMCSEIPLKKYFCSTLRIVRPAATHKNALRNRRNLPNAREYTSGIHWSRMPSAWWIFALDLQSQRSPRSGYAWRMIKRLYKYPIMMWGTTCLTSRQNKSGGGHRFR